MRRTNLLQSTINAMSNCDKNIDEVVFVSCGKQQGTWEEFAAIAKDINFDPGYGMAEINLQLKVVGNNWWLERAEYDGSEWWEFKTMPVMSLDALPLTKECVNEREL